MLLTAPRGGSTAAPDKFCAFVSIDSVVWKPIQSLELVVSVRYLLVFVSSWRLLAFVHNSWPAKVLRGGCA